MIKTLSLGLDRESKVNLSPSPTIAIMIDIMSLELMIRLSPM